MTKAASLLRKLWRWYPTARRCRRVVFALRMQTKMTKVRSRKTMRRKTAVCGIMIIDRSHGDHDECFGPADRCSWLPHSQNKGNHEKIIRMSQAATTTTVCHCTNWFQPQHGMDCCSKAKHAVGAAESAQPTKASATVAWR